MIFTGTRYFVFSEAISKKDEAEGNSEARNENDLVWPAGTERDLERLLPSFAFTVKALLLL